tara:strand:- start:2462 stop:2950 length:489 start_codon:yes stop_codon:yes gene_type:complete
MNEHDKNFLKNMSPLLIAALVMFFMLVAFETKADHNEDNYEKQKALIDMANDGIIGYTEHGIAITKDEIKTPALFTGDIINAMSKGDNIIRIKMRNNEQYNLHTSFCWDLDFASGYIFGKQGFSSKFNRVEPGLRIFTVAFGTINQSNYCVVTKITMINGVG